MSYEQLLNDARTAAGRRGRIICVAPTGKDSYQGTSWAHPKQTFQGAVDAAKAGDTILMAPNEYDEDVVIKTNRLTVIGAGPFGSVRVTGLAPNGTAVTIDGTDDTVIEVALVNLNLGGRGTGSGLHLKGATRRIRVEDCRLSGGANGAKLESTAAGQVVDTDFTGCKFASATDGLVITASGGGDPVSQTFVKDSLLHYISGVSLNVLGGHTTGLVVENCIFGVQEDGNPPTDFILADEANTTGSITGCKFAHATHASSVIALAAGVLYAGNYTEEGVNTARPD